MSKPTVFFICVILMASQVKSGIFSTSPDSDIITEHGEVVSQNSDDEFILVEKKDLHDYIESSRDELLTATSQISSTGYSLESLIRQLFLLPIQLNNNKELSTFDSGTVLIMGMNQEVAKNVKEYMDSKKTYSRISTHKDMYCGHDLLPENFIPGKDQTIRHFLWSEPQPYKEGDDLNNAISSLVKENTSDLFEENFRDNKYYFRFKPESYGTNTLQDGLLHLGSFLYSKTCRGYKYKDTYFGDGKNSVYNGNGCLVIDIDTGFIGSWNMRQKLPPSNHAPK